MKPNQQLTTASAPNAPLCEEANSAPGQEFIEIEGARVHNLKGVSLRIPRRTLTVITGLSGSGKSSLAFDVIFAEGQRRFFETLSAYARRFMPSALERPDVERVAGIGPVVAIQQRTTASNPRSTVGTITEISDFVRLLFSRAATGYSPITGRALSSLTIEEIVSSIVDGHGGHTVTLLAPQVRGRKGHFGPLFTQLLQKGFLYARIDGAIRELDEELRLSRYATHDIDLVYDRGLEIDSSEATRAELISSIRKALKLGKGAVAIIDQATSEERYYSTSFAEAETGFSLPKPEAFLFSFNTPRGWCTHCSGKGVVAEIEPERLIGQPDLPITKGGIIAEGLTQSQDDKFKLFLRNRCRKMGIHPDTPLQDIDPDLLTEFIVGDNALIQRLKELIGWDSEDSSRLLPFCHLATCPECNGARLRPEALHFRVSNLNIHQVNSTPLDELKGWIDSLEDNLSGPAKSVAREISREISSRVQFLLNVGLGYLSLGRPAGSLSGGEMQRIRLATQIGTHLVNVLYILDEPSIGLHPRDNQQLIESLHALRDQGNSVIVVEHDEEMMRQADHLIDMGPAAGRKGGEIVAQGAPASIVAEARSLTGQYLAGSRSIPVPKERRPGNGLTLILRGATGHNLKGGAASFPLGTFICITGVSGSGKSTLINQTLYPILSQRLMRAHAEPLAYASIEGVEHLDKVIQVDQSPLGRTPRSNPATYTGLMTEIRALFANTPDARIRGYKPGRFSFNVAGGRCERCKGAGVEVHEMGFMPAVHTTCTNCNGARYNRETLTVRFNGKNIAQVLDMTVNQAAEFFVNVPKILRPLQVLQSVGMGYVKLGQPCTTVSGGESQRIRLASELARRSTGKTLYLLDEPSTGLHFEDIRLLLGVINALVERGNTVIVIEHNLDIIKSADHLIDIGPESGARGGEILVAGTPEQVASSARGLTSAYLASVLK